MDQVQLGSVGGLGKVRQRRLYWVEEKPRTAGQMHGLGVLVAQANCRAALKSRITMASVRLNRSWWGQSAINFPTKTNTALPYLSDNQGMVLD